MKLVAKDVCIDLGTSSTLIYVKNKDIVLNEPSVVAINNITDEILAVGNEAKEMLGRTPKSIAAIKPLKSGVIANYYGARKMLEYFMQKSVEQNMFNKPRIIISVPYGITDVEERAVEEVGYSVGAKEVYIMEETMAAAIGSGIKVDSPEGSMIVDIGGGTTEAAVISLGGIVVSNAIRLAGDDMNRDIVEYVKNKYNVLIGENVAEEVKNNIGAAFVSLTEEKMKVKGRNLETGLPDSVTITTSDTVVSLSRILEEIIKLINETLEKTPPELAADVMGKGIILSGGCAQIKKIDAFISSRLGIPVLIAEKPEEVVARGMGITLNNIDVLKKTVKNRRR